MFRRYSDGHPCADSLSPPLQLGHRQPLFAMKPMNAVDARGFSLSPQQETGVDSQSAVTRSPAPVAGREAPYPDANMTDGGPSCGPRRGCSGPTFRQAHHGLKMRDRLALRSRFTDDGRLRTRAMPPSAHLTPDARQKTYLFADSDAGGRHATFLYTLIKTARLNGINPEARLADVSSRVADPLSQGSTICCYVPGPERI